LKKTRKHNRSVLERDDRPI